MFAGALPLAAYLPLILSSRAYFKGFYMKPEFSQIERMYRELFFSSNTIWVFYLALALVIVAYLMAKTEDGNSRHQTGTVPPEELLLATVLSVLPLAAFVLSKLIVGQILLRYTLSAAFGFSALVAYLLFHLSSRKAYPLVVVVVVGVFFSLRAVNGVHTLAKHEIPDVEALNLLNSVPEGLPILTGSCTEYIPVSYYAKPELAKRVYCLADLERAFQASKVDAVERAVLTLDHWTPNLHVSQVDAFVSSHREFWIAGSLRAAPWLLPTLQSMNGQITLVKEDYPSLLLKVSLADPSHAAIRWPNGPHRPPPN